MSELKTLVDTIAKLQTQVEALTQAGPPAQRRATQRSKVEERRAPVWINLGSPNGYVHPSGRAKVEWDGRRWVATVDGKRLRKSYPKSYNARVAAGIKLAAKN